MRRIRMFLTVFKYLVVAGSAMYIQHSILSKFPTFRKFMFNELTEKNEVSETEQSFMWTWIFCPVMAGFYTNCKMIFAALKALMAYPFIWKKIAEYTSILYAGKFLCKKFITFAVVEPCKRFAIKEAKSFCKLLCALCCTSLMSIGLYSVLDHYQIRESMTAAIACMGTAMPFL